MIGIEDEVVGEGILKLTSELEGYRLIGEARRCFNADEWYVYITIHRQSPAGRAFSGFRAGTKAEVLETVSAAAEIAVSSSNTAWATPGPDGKCPVNPENFVLLVNYAFKLLTFDPDAIAVQLVPPGSSGGDASGWRYACSSERRGEADRAINSIQADYVADVGAQYSR